MPDQLQEEHLEILVGLLKTGWDKSNTTYSSDPHVSTGWWDWGRDIPMVTVTNPEVNPQSGGGGGQTGYTYMTGDGRVGQRWNGYCLINCWGGTFDTPALAGEDTDGSRLSPKVASAEFAREVRRILLANAAGTTDSNGDVQLTHLAPNSERRIVEADPDEEQPTLFRYEVEARFGYTEES